MSCPTLRAAVDRVPAPLIPRLYNAVRAALQPDAEGLDALAEVDGGRKSRAWLLVSAAVLARATAELKNGDAAGDWTSAQQQALVARVSALRESVEEDAAVKEAAGRYLRVLREQELG